MGDVILDLKEIKLDKSIPTPLYFQLKQQLLKKINDHGADFKKAVSGERRTVHSTYTTYGIFQHKPHHEAALLYG